MENPRAEKVAVVDEVRERFGQANAAILTEYRGLKVKDLATLRRTLTAAGGEYRIYKNTLVRFAARDLGLQDLEDLLVGPTAIAFVDGDAAAVAKALRDYARTNPALVVKGGVLGNRVVDAAAAAALADLPSREVLLSRIAGGLAAPMQQFAGLLQALPRNFAYGLKALVEKGGGVPAADEPEPAAAAAEAPEPEAPVAETPVAEAPAAEAAEATAAEAPAAEAPAAEVVADATATDDTAAASPSETETDTTTPAEAAPSAETQE